MKQVKCAHCGSWTSTSTNKCDVCGNAIIDNHKEEEKKRKSTEVNSLPIIEIPESDTPLQKLWKKPLQLIQLVFFGIISLIAAIASSTVH